MPEQDPAAPLAETVAAPASPAAAAAAASAIPSFPHADEASKWKEIEPDHLAWRRTLVERQLRQERLDQWTGYGFRLLEYAIVVGFGVAFVWLGFYAVDHKASGQAAPLIGGGMAGLVSAVLAVRNRRN
ncbi:hypothetical protein EDE04_6775 [Streptomyces sp. 2132.2]|uniref:hypothetical protein n=1 Tax=Streptomyces sp. 2132.2 TaxID=2485161 RepID=UPI000F494575|nr:hypothetical protein [Streptomyces sp. 2132.2]ROR00214.1 hypothetical protein EDE04_6775 [Streptomyces sp. 2132.2]